MHFFTAKLKLIHAGLVTEASDLDQLFALTKGGIQGEKAADPSPKESEDQDSISPNTIQAFLKKIDLAVEKALDSLASSGQSRRPIKSILRTEALRKVEKQILSSIPSLACANCGGQSPKFRHEAQTKVFEKALSAKQRSLMESRGKVFQKLVFPKKLSGATTDEDAKSTTSSRKGKTVKRSELIKKQEPVSSDEDSDDASSQAQEVSETLVSTQTSWNTTDVYLTPLQVSAHLNMLWENDRPLFDLLYGSLDIKSGRRVSSPDVFFLHVVPVTPNRFRPLSKMGDMTYEHPQNAHLTAILKSNQLMMQLREQEKRALAAIDPISDPKLYANTKSEYLLKTIEAWIQLQTGVNSLIDNSKSAPVGGTAPPPGIRQVLEKKEGLFRKHMMGKRVNFAARSVISPDPYIETSEIGVCV